jgi:hypothetical protein
MKNATITIEEEVARWDRIRTAENDTSLFRLIGDLLREKMVDESNCETSMQYYLSRSPSMLKNK